MRKLALARNSPLPVEKIEVCAKSMVVEMVVAQDELEIVNRIAPSLPRYFESD